MNPWNPWNFLNPWNPSVVSIQSRSGGPLSRPFRGCSRRQPAAAAESAKLAAHSNASCAASGCCINSGSAITGSIDAIIGNRPSGSSRSSAPTRAPSSSFT